MKTKNRIASAKFRVGVGTFLIVLAFIGVLLANKMWNGKRQLVLSEAVQLNTPVSISPHGEKLFNSYCAACHQLGGQGVEGRVPPLDGSPWVSGSEDRLIRIVLNGLHGPIEIRGSTYNLEMPAFRQAFSDDDIAAILTYVRHRYGEPSPPVKKETVAQARNVTHDRESYWTVEELQQLER